MTHRFQTAGSDDLDRLPRRISKFNDPLKEMKIPAKIIFVIIGILSTIWFFIRVIPKPVRATYPCMQAAAPLMSGFIIWISSLLLSIIAFKKAKTVMLRTRKIAAFGFIVLGILGISLLMASRPEIVCADVKTNYLPNTPAGIARGIFPGRVVRAHNPEVANWDTSAGFWREDQYNNQKETDKLVREALTSLTGTKNEKKAWDLQP